MEQHEQGETRKEHEGHHEGHEEHHEEHKEHHEEHKEHIVTVTVNEEPVKIRGPKATGRQIKEAAIAQGVQIDLGFVLSEEIGLRRTRIVGDNDEVTVHNKSRFVAVAPDDNS
jgi:hypothetical protein